MTRVFLIYGLGTLFTLLSVPALCLEDYNMIEDHLVNLMEEPQNKKDLCRVSNGGFFDTEDFRLFSCATCYQHLPKAFFVNETKFTLRWWQGKVWLRDPSTGELHRPSTTNMRDSIRKTFLIDRIKDLWDQCCKAAMECCWIMKESPHDERTDLRCPKTWDGWGCWPDTPNGTIAKSRCPSHIYFHSKVPPCTRYATKECLPNATWFRNVRGKEFTDYSLCGNAEDLKTYLNVHVITFSISIVLLIPALAVFFCYRQLRVIRIFMHKNLFISLLLTSAFVVTFESYIITDSIDNPNSSIIRANHAGCKIFYTITKYLRLSTYTWMFCEGFYLHKLIANAFAEQKNVAMFLAIGWGLPIVPVSIWAILRKLMADDNCWTIPAKHFEWVMYSPMLLTLLINLIFLGHIIQVIVTKLRSSHANEPAQFRRAVKATVVLIPLFGLHFLFLIYHPRDGGCKFLKIYNIILYSIDGLQGSVVALLFCYFNNEIHYLVKRTYRRRQLLRDAGSYADRSRTARGSRTSVSTNMDSIVVAETTK